MSVVIRPAPEVFQRKSPMVLIFGAFRRAGDDLPPMDHDITFLRDVVENARRYRQVLAFSRRINPGETLPDGHWLPGCRPKISDRLFDHVGASCFSNSEFAAMYAVFAPRLIQVAGPENDSSLAATVLDEQADRTAFRMIAARQPLQNCSTVNGNAAVSSTLSPQCPSIKPVDIIFWLNELRSIETR
ncbi:hypothetical protein [Halovulum sp. GXIMD14793]